MTFTTPAEFSAFQGGTGQYRAQSITDALLLGESDVEGWLETFLTPTAQTEEFIWPIDNGLIMLKKVRTISVDAVVAVHSLDCSCEWTTLQTAQSFGMRGIALFGLWIVMVR